MTQPVTRHVDAALADHSIAHIQSQADAVMDNAVPVIGVQHRSDQYYTYDSALWNKRQARRRAPGDPAAKGGYSLSTATYTCELFSIAHKDPKEEQANADPALDARLDATEWTAGQLLMEADAQIASVIMAAGAWDTDVDGVSSGAAVGTSVLHWSDASSDPITDMVQLGGLVQTASTKLPNVAIIGRAVWETLINNAAIIDRVKHTSSESITKEMIARLFEVEKVIVPMLTNNTAAEGQTATMARLFNSDDVGLFYFPPNPGLRTPSAAYVYGFDGDDYTRGSRVSTWYDPDTNSDMTQNDLYIDVKITGTSFGAFIDGAIA